jgi:allantoinase
MTQAPDGWRWPGGARLALSLVLNFEEGAELSIARGDERNESVYEAVEEISGAPDLCMESHFAYGIQEGWPRIRRLLRQYGVTVTVSACGRAALFHPWLIREAVADGHEIAAHGWRWERHAGMAEGEERAVIARTARTLEEIAGTAPLGWHTRSGTSVNTRRLLVEHGGFLYDSNDYDADVPRIHDMAGRRHVILPYAFDTNDMRFYNGGGFVQAEDFSRYCLGALDCLLAESDERPRILSVGLHLRIIGRPGRIAGLHNFLEQASQRDGVWFARRCDIAHAWLAHR